MANQERIVHGKSYASPEEMEAYKQLRRLKEECPIPGDEVLANSGLFFARASFGRMLFMHKLYLAILNTHGVIMEFGVRWGHNMALFTTFRSLYEPYNVSRKIIGFDTFEGFPDVAPEDGASDTVHVGSFSVTPDYENYLGQILSAHENLAPRSQIKKHALVKGNVVETLPRYLKDHPETIIALAYLDLDLYEPTKKCLEFIRPHLAKNSVVGFDELVLDEFPGETQALKDAWGLSDFEIVRDPVSTQQSYIVMR